MSKMSRATWLLLPFALLLTGCEFDHDHDWGGSSDKFKQDFHMSYPLKPGGRVSVESFNGSVEVLAWDRDEVDISGTKYASTQERLDQLKVDVIAGADAVRVRSIKPAQQSGWRGGAGVRYVLKVPRRTELDRIESSNGAVHVEGTEGAARLKSSNGAVKVNSLRGNLHAHTSNGSVELRDVTGDADLHTSNGRIRAEQHKGAATAETSNGSIRLDLLRTPAGKAIRAESSNGGIEINLPAANENDVHADTSNGGITVRIPGDSRATIKAHTSNAKVTTDFDVATTFTNKSKTRLDGTINGGGLLLDLASSNGNIRIERQ